MQTTSAERSQVWSDEGVASLTDLIAIGCTRSTVRRQVESYRWRRVGRAIVLHNGPLTREQECRAVLLNSGPRAVLTAFTALEALGLVGWSRPEVHVLVPVGSRHPTWIDTVVVLHRSTAPLGEPGPKRLDRAAPAAVRAASTLSSARSACGLLAATVQQRLTTVPDLRYALNSATRTRHRATMLLAVDDIQMGAEALSEIDFVRLCRRYGLPPPVQQAVRVEPNGRRRYVDAEWRRSDGRRVVVEVDGAVHLAPKRWFEDQLRQNEIALTGTTVLRFPSVIVREEPGRVADQVRRALLTPQR